MTFLPAQLDRATDAAHRSNAVRARNREERSRYPLGAIGALAALAVIVSHAYQNNVDLPDAYTADALGRSTMEALASAVDVFFVLTGFLIWLPVAKAVLAGRVPGSGRVMLRRRVIRLIPTYFVIVLVAWVVANPAVQRGNYVDLLLHLSLTQIYSPQMIFYSVGPAWALAIEFHFFVLIALTTWLVGRLATRVTTPDRRLLVALSLPTALIAVGAGFLLWAIVLAPQSQYAWTVWFSAPSKAADFGVGMLLAVAVARGVTVRATRRRLAVLGAAGLVVIAILLAPAVSPVVRQWAHLTYAAAALLAIGAVVTNAGAHPRWLTNRPLTYLGTLSFTLYLVHEFVMMGLRVSGLLSPQGSAIGVATTSVATAVVATGVAALLHRFVELPAQRIGDIWERTQPIPAASPAGPPLDELAPGRHAIVSDLSSRVRE